MTDSQTFRLMYRSRDRISPDERKVALGALFTKARSNNKALGVTGALLVDGDQFVQTLEGDEPEVRTLFDRIKADPRHDSVELISTEMVPERVFARWSMARVGHDGEPDIALIAHTDGISPASSRGGTPGQVGVLEAMRRAAVRADEQVF